MLPDFYNPEVSKLNFYVIENDKDDWYMYENTAV
jgi:hypothetical protein